MQKNIKVKDRGIGYDQPIFLTAEIGCSHMGNVALAKEMPESVTGNPVTWFLSG